MATQSYPTPTASDPSGLVILSHLVDRTDALRAKFSGTSEPSPTVAYQEWADTTTGMLRRRNSTNTAWVDVCPLAFLPKHLWPMQTSGALAAGSLRFAAPFDCTVSRVLIVPDTSTTGSSAGVTDYNWRLTNVTQSLQLFSSYPDTATVVSGVGGGELVADAANVLTPDQNAAVDALDVLQFTVGVNGSPTAVANCSIAVEFAPRGA